MGVVRVASFRDGTHDALHCRIIVFAATYKGLASILVYSKVCEVIFYVNTFCDFPCPCRKTTIRY